MDNPTNTETYPEEIRFDMDANDTEGAMKYFQRRAIQMLAAGFRVRESSTNTFLGQDVRWTREKQPLEEWGVETSLILQENGKTNTLHCVYIFKDHRYSFVVISRINKVILGERDTIHNGYKRILKKWF
jgi:hypothetical protein